MFDVNNAKQQASVLAEYLQTVGKRLKHTHALEAIAKISGYSSWNKAQEAAAGSATPPAMSLAEIFARDAVDMVEAQGQNYVVATLNREALKAAVSIPDNARSLDSSNHPVVELELDKLISRARHEPLTFSLHDLLAAKREGCDWLFPDGRRVRVWGNLTMQVL